MAWIKSYQEIERHPKTLVLMKEMNWPLDVAISKLHRLWWWCADYAYDGDISKHDPDIISAAIGCQDMRGDYLIGALIKSGFVDREPLQLHDWWAHFGDFLRGRFARTPEKWQQVEARYTIASVATAKQLYQCSPLDKGNKEKKEITTLSDKSDGFGSFWKVYPKKTGKSAALKAWLKANPPIDKCLKTLEWQISSEQWTKDGGQYIPNPATWISQGRWEDIRQGYDMVKCSVCGEDGSLPKGVSGRPVCRKCKDGAVAGQIGGNNV